MPQIAYVSKKTSVARKGGVVGEEKLRIAKDGFPPLRYDAIGRIEVISEVNARGELLRAEAYVYDEKDRRIFTVSEKGLLTSYFYDAQSRLQKVLYPYTEEKRAADKTEAQEEGLFFIEGNIKPVNYFLNQKEKSAISRVLEKISYGRSNYLTTTQVQWEETYTYDANGNRASKTTTFGTIRYWYDAENRLVHSGSDRARGSDYTYDANGNLLTKINLYKTEEYSYTGTNRMKKSVVTDHIKKTKTITHYDYDAFGRRTLVQDEGGKIIRTLYDGLSFDIIREQETFADGYFTNTRDTGIQWGKVSEGEGSRYRYIGDDAPAAKEQNGYSLTATNRASSRVALYANGQAVGVTRSSNYASSERSYFGTDLMGTVRSSTTDSGNAEYYEYDVFGKPYGESISDYAYTGKPYDPVTGMYNYGYRDYVPQIARFTTIDPIRDGSNWFAYCNNEPVNFLDLWGLSAGDKKVEVALIIFRDLNSYNITQDRANFQNGNLDSALFINKTTGEILFIDRVQTVANYPLTKPDTSPAANSFPDTIAATSFDFIYKTETTAATGPAAVIGNTKTISGKSVDANGNTENGATPGRTLWHSPGKPDGSGDYRIAYSQACFIPETSLDNDKVFDTLEAWGVKDEDVIKGKVEIKKPWEKGI